MDVLNEATVPAEDKQLDKEKHKNVISVIQGMGRGWQISQGKKFPVRGELKGCGRVRNLKRLMRRCEAFSQHEMMLMPAPACRRNRNDSDSDDSDSQSA